MSTEMRLFQQPARAPAGSQVTACRRVPTEGDDDGSEADFPPQCLMSFVYRLEGGPHPLLAPPVAGAGGPSLIADVYRSS